jgi:lipopolysaccharide heptosyltransferase I
MPDHVLLIRLGAFGDIIHTLPLAADLATAGWTVEWLVEDRWRQLLDGNPAVTRTITLDRATWRSGGWGVRHRLFRHLRRRLRQTDYAAVIDAQGLAKSALWSMVSGCPRRIGHRRGRSREGAWLVNRVRVPADGVHVIDQQRALALPLLGDRHPRGGWRFPLPAWPTARDQMAQWSDGQGLDRPWLLNVGAGWPTKVWPVVRFVELARLLLDQGERVVLLWGSAAERAVADGVVREAPGATLAPPTDLACLAELLRRGRILVSGDTGPLHLALAVGTPTVGIFGPVPAVRNGPRGRRHRNLQAPAAAWERRDLARVDLGAISAAAVLAEGREALG